MAGVNATWSSGSTRLMQLLLWPARWKKFVAARLEILIQGCNFITDVWVVFVRGHHTRGSLRPLLRRPHKCIEIAYRRTSGDQARREASAKSILTMTVVASRVIRSPTYVGVLVHYTQCG